MEFVDSVTTNSVHPSPLSMAKFEDEKSVMNGHNYNYNHKKKNKTKPVSNPDGPKKVSITTISGDTVVWPANHTLKKISKGRVNHFMQNEVPSSYAVDNSKLGEVVQKEDEFNAEVLHSRVPAAPLDRSSVVELKSMRSPPAAVHRICQAIAVLLYVSDLSWPGCQDMMANPDFLNELNRLRAGYINNEEVVMARSIISEGALVPDQVRKQSTHAANVLYWLLQVLENADKRAQMEAVKWMQQAAAPPISSASPNTITTTIPSTVKMTAHYELGSFSS